MTERLQKILSGRGVCSRRKAEEYINANFSYYGTDSRIIIQSLLQNSNISPMKQAKIFTDIINSFGLCISAPTLDVLLPVGISFYTFQALGFGRAHFFCFRELTKSIEHVSKKVLTENLRSMEEDGLLNRTVYPVVPPKVEYSLTAKGKSLQLVIDALFLWGEKYKNNEI